MKTIAVKPGVSENQTTSKTGYPGTKRLTSNPFLKKFPMLGNLGGSVG